MAKTNSKRETVEIPVDTFSVVALRLEQISDMLSALGVQTAQIEDGQGVANQTLGSALCGYADMIVAVHDLLAPPVGADETT